MFSSAGRRGFPAAAQQEADSQQPQTGERHTSATARDRPGDAARACSLVPWLAGVCWPSGALSGVHTQRHLPCLRDVCVLPALCIVVHHATPGPARAVSRGSAALTAVLSRAMTTRSVGTYKPAAASAPAPTRTESGAGPRRTGSASGGAAPCACCPCVCALPGAGASADTVLCPPQKDGT